MGWTGRKQLGLYSYKDLIGNPGNLTVQAFVGQYWNPYLDRIEAKPSTRKSYASILKSVLPCVGEVPLAKVTPLHIEQILKERSKKVSAKTMLNELGLLQSIAVDNDLMERSPVRSKHKPKVVRAEKPIWSPGAADSGPLPEQHRALFTCCACTGVRVGELLALTWGNGRFEDHSLSPLQ